MSTEDIICRINGIVSDHLNEEFEMIHADKAGLDFRCGGIFISEDAIAVERYIDGALQYYGGFEYVEKLYRQEIGDYVFYLRESDRVAGHIDQYFESKQEA